MHVVIAEDDPLHRAFLRGVLQEALPPPLVIDEAADGLAAIEIACRQPVDAVVLDLQMPNVSGAEAAKAIWHCKPGVKILFWTNFSDEAYVRGVSKIVPENTVYGYILKSSSEERTRFAIKAVFLEEQCLVDREIWGVQQRSQNRIDGLTDVEYEVLIDIALGLTDRAIAFRRNISTRGVQARLRHLYEKLGLDILADEAESGELYNLRSRAVFCAFSRKLLNFAVLENEERRLQSWLGTRNEVCG